jgi:hypothetical protein
MMRTLPPRVVSSSKAGISSRSPDHLMKETSRSAESADCISFASSCTSCGSVGDPVNRLLSASAVSGRGTRPSA